MSRESSDLESVTYRIYRDCLGFSRACGEGENPQAVGARSWPRRKTAGLVPAGAGARGAALHPPQQSLDVSDDFRHPPLDVIEFQ